MTVDPVVPIRTAGRFSRSAVLERQHTFRAEDAPDPGTVDLGRRVALTTGALLAARLVVIAAGIVTLAFGARYLRLQAFGELTAAMAFSSMFAVMADLGLCTVASRQLSREPGSEATVLGSVLAAGLGAAVLLIALGVATMQLAYGGAADVLVRRAALILLAQLLCVPVTGTGRALLTASQRGHLIGLGDVALSLGMAVGVGVAVGIGLGYEGIVVAITSGYVLQAAVMGGLMFRIGPVLRFDRRVALCMVRAGLPFAGTLVLNYLYFRLDVFLLSWMTSAADVARYGLAYRVLEGLMVLPGYVMTALFPLIARTTEQPRRLRHTVGVALGCLEPLALLAGGVVAIFSRQIVVLLGGPGYAQAATPLAVLAVALAISYISGVYGNAMMAMGRGRTLLRVTLAPLGVNLALNLALIPTLGILGAAVAVVFSELTGLLLVRRKYVQLAGRPAAPPHARILVAGIVFVLSAALVNSLSGAAPLLVVGVGAPAVTLVYFGLLVKVRALPDEIRLPSRVGLRPVRDGGVR
jgi:O-antigen/teichoic acid export membrane protein